MSFAWIVGSATLVVRGVPGVVLALASSALYSAMVYQGQKDFNAYIRVTGGEQTERAHAMESIGLVLAIAFSALLFYDELKPTP